jgi:type II secretory pathway pseudopilin PulG
MYRSLKALRAGMHGLTVLECVFAIVILTIASLFFGSAMVAATRAEAKAAEHTQAIMVGNYLLETMRRDGTFWDDSQTHEWVGPLCSAPSNCWTLNPNTDRNSSPLPAYDDPASPTPVQWHTGFQPADDPNVTLPNYHFVWRADPINQSSFTTGGVAALTIELYIDEECPNACVNGPVDVYVVKGLNRED